MAARQLAPPDILVGTTIDYFSSAMKAWLPVTITKVDSQTGAVEISLRPGHWFQPADVEKKMRRHMKPGRTQLEWARNVMGSDRFAEELDDFFQRHATDSGGEQVILWSSVSGLALDLDNHLALSGSVVALEAEAKPRRGRTDGEALSHGAFRLAFWKVLHNTLRDYGEVLNFKRPASRRGGPACDADYELQRELKAGSFGEVRLVREKATGSRLAVKSISKSFMRGSEDMLDQEIENLRRVDHPNIVKLHRIWDDGASIHLVMDFCSGGDLDDRIRQAKGPFPLQFVRHIMLQLMWAVAHVHARGLAHLDIKGLNIMLTHRDSTILPLPSQLRRASVEDHSMPHVMLIDLGLAQLFRPGDSKREFPGGTPSTMSPEIWHGEVTPAADIFSCGIVFWELATLQINPIGLQLSGTLQDFIRQATVFWEKGPAWRWALWKHMPGEGRALCASMLERDRRERPAASTCVVSGFLSAAVGGGVRTMAQSTPKVTKLMIRLGTSHERSILYKTLAMRVARKWPSNQLPTIHSVFRSLDRAGSGFLDVSEVSKALKIAGAQNDMADAAAKAIDLNKDGQIDWTEFVAACVPLGDADFEPMLRERFSTADSDGDGYLTRSELVRLLPGFSADDLPAISLHKLLCRAGATVVDWDAFHAHFKESPKDAQTVFLL
eukprot:CAMPEP_0176053712 /NCGR_PEP_ID=MMETSP0120_2-20121206/26719_1 /TAXON_ID=160619 /ORGANISM="Kryptoperidinium foliaceum, Strain CCMP 1326" /LENGTH=665 /DNA_ID=CAMNT_0017387171 /DNA_START=84 /DNA_END=2081 /DNA_ORIENTATION=+